MYLGTFEVHTFVLITAPVSSDITLPPHVSLRTSRRPAHPPVRTPPRRAGGAQQVARGCARAIARQSGPLRVARGAARWDGSADGQRCPQAQAGTHLNHAACQRLHNGPARLGRLCGPGQALLRGRILCGPRLPRERRGDLSGWHTVGLRGSLFQQSAPEGECRLLGLLDPRNHPPRPSQRQRATGQSVMR